MPKPKLKLFFWSPQALPSLGGLQNVVHYWAEELTLQGHSVVVGTRTPAVERENSYSYPVLRDPSFSNLVRAMRRADAVIMFNISMKEIPQWLLSFRPLIISHHTALAYNLRNPGFLPSVKRWVANNLAGAQCACSAFVARAYSNCRVVPNPFRAETKEEGLKKREGILFVGRLVSDKGLDTVLHAFAMIKEEKVSTSPILSVIGVGPELINLKVLATKLGIENQVEWLGQCSSQQAIEAMQQCRLLVVPSVMEPFGLVVLEGLASGADVLVSRQGGLPEAGGSLVFYADPGDPVSWAKMMIRILGAEKSFIEHALKESHLSPYFSQHSANSFLQFVRTVIR